MNSPSTPPPPPLLVTFGEAAVSTRYTVRHLYREADRGRLRTVGRGKARRVLYSSLLDYVGLLDREGRAPRARKRTDPK